MLRVFKKKYEKRAVKKFIHLCFKIKNAIKGKTISKINLETQTKKIINWKILSLFLRVTSTVRVFIFDVDKRRGESCNTLVLI